MTTKSSPPLAEYWDFDDKRFPLTVDREPPSKAFCDSMKERQLQPIGMGHNKTDGWFILWGRKRLLACQANKQPVMVIPIKNVSPEDAAKYSAYENMQRSGNPISDFIAIKTLLAKPGATYETVAKSLGIPVTKVKVLEKDWHKVPDWILKEVQEGNIAPSTAKKLGSAKPSIVKKLQKGYDPEVGITMSMVEQTTNVTLAELMPEMLKESPKVVSVSVLDTIVAMLVNKEGKEKIIQYIHEVKKG